jgi:hypothetical protein
MRIGNRVKVVAQALGSPDFTWIPNLVGKAGTIVAVQNIPCNSSANDEVYTVHMDEPYRLGPNPYVQSQQSDSNKEEYDFYFAAEELQTMESRTMLSQVALPQAFSVRDEHEFESHRHLVFRLNPKLKVAQVATGKHINGTASVYWGLVYLEDTVCSTETIMAALAEAGFDVQHNGSVKSFVGM